MKVKYATIIVRDMEESVRFYADVTGFEIASRHEPALGLVTTLMKSAGDAMVELIKNPHDEVGPYSVDSLAFCEDPNGVRIALIQHD